jgi:hypothetical protein
MTARTQVADGLSGARLVGCVFLRSRVWVRSSNGSVGGGEHVGVGPPDERAVSRAVLDILRLLAAGAPVIVAIDDAQWLDAPSARVIGFAVRRLAAAPIGILVSLRTETAGGAAPLGLDRGLPEGRLHRMALGPLNLAAIHQLVGRRLGTALPRHTLVRLYGACDVPSLAGSHARSCPAHPTSRSRPSLPMTGVLTHACPTMHAGWQTD